MCLLSSNCEAGEFDCALATDAGAARVSYAGNAGHGNEGQGLFFALKVSEGKRQDPMKWSASSKARRSTSSTKIGSRRSLREVTW